LFSWYDDAEYEQQELVNYSDVPVGPRVFSQNADLRTL
jgi:hypothetical protein